MGIRGNNSYLKAFMLVKRTKPLLLGGKRAQVRRSGIMAIQQTMSRAWEQLQKAEGRKNNMFIVGNMVGILEIVKALLQDENYVETDTETKELLLKKLDECIDAMYPDVAEYYMTHDFDPEADPVENVLQDIIDTCICRGYYFGEDKLIEEELRNGSNRGV